jgi:hypothetical protein
MVEERKKGSVKILQYFQMECNSARKIIEGVLREYSVL